MAMEIPTFGDIILYCEEQYVFLCATTEIIYLAKIINGKSENGIMLKKFSERLVDVTNQPQVRQNNKNALLCFVTLTTESFNGDLAHLNNSQNQFNFQITKTMDRLNHDDIVELKNKILDEEIIPGQLKRLTAELDIK